MKLFSQDIKAEMERCKRVARKAGLQFDDNTMEYIVTNREMTDLQAKHMVPTMYDFWVHDIETIRARWIYKVFPHNPYESVINTRPPLSFYNQDNPDWLNVAIFYHVLGHIDFFQNNTFFRNTRDYDFTAVALADKRLLNRIRSELGSERRWVDYVLEFSRAIDNFAGYFPELKDLNRRDAPEVFGVFPPRVNFYFGEFLRNLHDARVIEVSFYHNEVDRFNECVRQVGWDCAEEMFFADERLRGKFPEFPEKLRKWEKEDKKQKPRDLFEYLMEHSPVLKEESNQWMKEVLHVVRRTSLYFQPQIRTKIANEGWASFWGERLFTPDPRISGHEVAFSVNNSGVIRDPRVGVNPYATGKHFYEFIEELARKGKLSRDYQLLQGIEDRKHFNRPPGDAEARKALFEVKNNITDALLIDFLSEKDFQDFVDKHNLFVAGVRPHQEEWGKMEIYIKSRNGEDYRSFFKKKLLYHPPHIEIDEEKAKNGELYLNHVYEGRSLDAKQIQGVLIGLEFLWGKRVRLETTEYETVQPSNWWEWWDWGYQPKYRIRRVLYTCENKRVLRTIL